MGPLPSLLESCAGSGAVDRAFREVRLPRQLVDDRDHRVPYEAIVDLFARAGRIADDPLFGLRVGLAMLPADFGPWMAYGAEAPSLREGLRRLALTIAAHQSGARLALRPAGRRHVVWTYTPPLRTLADPRMHVDHVIPVMIQFVRGFAGPAWRPAWIEAPYAEPRASTALPDATQSPWRFECTAVGLAMDTAALALPGTRQRRPRDRAPLCSADVISRARAGDAETAADRIRALITLRLLEGHTDIEGAAQLAGISGRTLQRVLREAGCSYRQLLDAVRLAKARALLRETGEPVTTIALALGYSDTAHFTRAFRRLAGVAPSVYRHCPPAAATSQGSPRHTCHGDGSAPGR
jgi:AraC-like DNA-binding protein